MSPYRQPIRGIPMIGIFFVDGVIGRYASIELRDQCSEKTWKLKEKDLGKERRSSGDEV